MKGYRKADDKGSKEAYILHPGRKKCWINRWGVSMKKRESELYVIAKSKDIGLI